MTVFLILILIVLFAVAIWQMGKIMGLSRVTPEGVRENSEIADEKDNRFNGWLMIAFLIFIYAITIYSFVVWGPVMLPDAAAEHGKSLDTLMAITVVVILIVQTVTQYLLHYFSYKYRGQKTNKATFFADSDKLEFIWTIVPAVVLAGLIIYGLFTWSNIMNVDTEDDPLVVELYAKQFSWEARYAGKNKILGQANVRFIEGTNTVGIDPSDTDAHDDFVTNELYLPVGKKVLFKMRSQDVLHSAYMPHFRAQMNVVPGMVTQFAYTPITTTREMRMQEDIIEKVNNINRIRREKNKELAAKGEETLDPYEFDFLLLCNKICGASHYNMQMNIVVVEQDEFDEWFESQQTFGDTL